MRMHTEYSLCLFWYLLLKDSIKIFKVGCRNKIFFDKTYEKLWFFERIAKYDNQSFNGDYLTVESQKCVERDANDKKERQLKE